VTYTPLELAAAFIQTGELDDALAQLDLHLDQQPQDDVARRLRISLQRHRGASLAVLQADYVRLAQRGPEDAMQLALAAELEAALSILAEAHTCWPDHERLTEQYLHTLAVQGDFETALHVVGQQSPGWRWWQWAGDLLVQAGDDMLATARYGLALAQLEGRHDPYLVPVRARLLLARAHAYRRLGLLDQAEMHYAAAADLMPDDPLIPFNRGLVAAAQGDLDRAEVICRAAFVAASAALRSQMCKSLLAHPLLRQRLEDVGC
jgi:tetratricopeptide (TPR) repeat protein